MNGHAEGENRKEPKGLQVSHGTARSIVASCEVWRVNLQGQLEGLERQLGGLECQPGGLERQPEGLERQPGGLKPLNIVIDLFSCFN